VVYEKLPPAKDTLSELLAIGLVENLAPENTLYGTWEI
jgi:hypothetical protein